MVANYQHEIKRLNERNKELIQQHESSEELLRDCQKKSVILQQKLDE